MKNKETQPEQLDIHTVMCCFDDETIKKLRTKLSRTYIEETKNSGEVYRLYFTKRQVDKIIQIVTQK